MTTSQPKIWWPTLRKAFELLRVSQWAKNSFVLIPIFVSPHLLNARNLELSFLAFCAFCAVASSGYIVNDFFDRAADRKHPHKRLRPLAAGSVPLSIAWSLALLLALIGIAIAVTLPWPFLPIIGVHAVVGLLYSVWLKHVSIVDVMTIMTGFVLRLLGGAAVIGAEPSIWIIAMSALLALFLALGKRRDDIVKQFVIGHRPSLAGYNRIFLDMSVSVVLGALLVVYMIYTTDPAVIARIGSRNLIVTVPFVMAGVLRYLQVMLVEERSGSPTEIALRDPFMLVTLSLWALSFTIVMYA